MSITAIHSQAPFAAAPIPAVSFAAFEEVPGRPAAKKIRTEHKAHGDVRADDYHWLRNKEDPDTLGYLKAWNAYTAQSLSPLNAFIEQLNDEFIGRMEPSSSSVPYQLGSYSYYSRVEEGQEHALLCRTKFGETAEEILLDGNEMARGEEYFSVKAMAPSPDGRYIAFVFDTDGSQFGKIYIKDMQDGGFIEVIDASNGDLLWNSHSSALWYTQINGEFRADKVRFHRIGTDPTEDPVITEEPNPLFELSVAKDKLDRWIIVTASSKDASEIFIGSLDDPSGPFRAIHPAEEGLKYHFIPGDEEHYFLVSKNRSNWGLYKVTGDLLGKEHWQEFIPATKEVDIVGVELFRNHVALLIREQGLLSVEVRDLKEGSSHSIEMPQLIGSIDFEHNENFEASVLRFTFDSPVTPLSTYSYDLDSKSLKLLKQTKAGTFDSAQYTSERVYALADDGTRVPLSLFYKKGISQDGTAPLYLYAYGSYGVTIDPYFSSVNASFLERGVVFAIAHIRGGGDLGRQWYSQGCMMNKMNTFTDFIQCAEHLIKAGFTNPNKLVIGGGSAGGLLMGAVINMRPDLFKACLAQVPFVDVVTTMFDETLPLTTEEWLEWGNPNIKEQYDYLKKYSPVDNVKAQDYPALYVVAGWNDKQVSYHEPAKWVAKLAAFKTNDNPLLFRTSMGAGHHGASGRYARFKECAPDIAFLLDQLGEAK